ncbi:MAG TPA: M23 family metallopeptidase [Chloroflexota bacterium]|nr:M23 family metallopeptidase [Chloroflexota bacterium]
MTVTRPRPFRHRRRRVLSAFVPAVVLATRARAARAMAPAGLPATAAPAVYFPETGHQLQAGFLEYWRGHQGPERLGPPVTEEYWDPGLEAMVQYFERARLEWRAAPQPAVQAVALPEALDEGAVRRLGPPAAAVPRAPGVPDWAVALAPPAPAIAALPGAVPAGRTLLVEVTVDDVATPLSVSGSLGGGPAGGLRFFPLGETRFAVLTAIAMDETPGQRVVTARASNGLGLESPVQEAVVPVVDGGFPSQRLAISSDLVPLVDPEVGRRESLTLAAVLAHSAPGPRWQGPFRLPVSGTLVTAHGARRVYVDPAGRAVGSAQHPGVDLVAPAGTPIVAPAAGVVAFVGTWSIKGNVVVLDHGAGVHSVYAHASVIAVAPGQTVAPGQLLGRVGSNGLSTGPHLHWEVRVGGLAVEPMEWTRRPELGLVRSSA